jgi:hypothetical protein
MYRCNSALVYLAFSLGHWPILRHSFLPIINDQRKLGTNRSGPHIWKLRFASLALYRLPVQV